ncbi:hypothetical protein ACFQHO_38415 [Actinomadura yumaensis]|uniref:hypothetical protein n=1 Tax=Actinomadura TaxID=1988 RepID=UPI00132B74A8|nr:hypothetical protein [Actinomadura sp. J1-007]MWK38610.1 hypothetical protein [Actinomadura sp. J1-007]
MTPENVETRSEAETRYRDLVRLAYFVLPGKGKRVHRLAVARRIVDGATARRPSRDARRGDAAADEARRRTRVLRTAMRPPRRLGVGLGPWLRALPARLPDPALTAALARLDPPVRVAYVLRRVAGMPRYAVRDQLADLRVPDPWAVIEAAERVEAVPPAGRAATFEPAPLRPVRRRSPLPIVAAGALTATLIGALVATENGGSLLAGPLFGGTRPAEARDLRLTAAEPGAWANGAPSLDTWPARGDLASDRAFTRRAVAAWARLRGGHGVGGAAQLLYAGHVDGTPFAVLRHGVRIARYTGTNGALDVAAAGGDPTGPIALPGGRYLLSPWDSAPVTPGGRRLAVRDGVTDPVTARTRCGRGPLFQVKGRDGVRTVGDLGGPRAVVLGHHTPAHRFRAGHAAPAKLQRAGLALWERLACHVPRTARPVAEATAWNFWSGELPYGAGTADWVCTRMAFAGGGTAGQATLLRAGEQGSTGWCDDRGPVSGTWWQAPSGAWYYFAAAARGLVPHADGPFRTARLTGRLLVATPPAAGARPEAPVSLAARTG